MHINLHGVLGKAEPCGSKAKEVRVNPCLLSSKQSRPHLSTYVGLIKSWKGAVLVASDREFDLGLLNAKLSLQHGEQTASSLYLRLEYYL